MTRPLADTGDAPNNAERNHALSTINEEDP